jgi:hypothetical protein
MARAPEVSVGSPKTSWFISERTHTAVGPLMTQRERDGVE